MSTPNIGDDDFVMGEKPPTDVFGLTDEQRNRLFPGATRAMAAQAAEATAKAAGLVAAAGSFGGGGGRVAERLTRVLSGTTHGTSKSPANMDPVIWVEQLGPHTFTYEFQNVPNDQAARIIRDVLPGVLELYMSKSRDYGGNVGEMIGLGAKATFVDIWRKVGKLKRALWDGQKMIGEQVDEILADLVGHVLIILDGMKRAD